MLSEVLLMPSLCLDVQGGALRYIEELSLGEPALVAENISCIGWDWAGMQCCNANLPPGHN